MKKIYKIITIYILFFSSICIANQSDSLQKLKDLYKNNILTEEQYNEGIQKILSNSETIIKLTDLFEQGVLTEEQFNEAKEKVLQKIGINNDVKTVVESQQSESSSLDGLYIMEVEWTWVSHRVSEVQVGDKAKFSLDIKNDEIKSLIAFDEKTGLVDKEIKFFSYRFAKEDNKKFKLKTSVRLKSDPNESLNSKWVLELIDKIFQGTVVLSKGADPLLKGNIF